MFHIAMISISRILCLKRLDRIRCDVIISIPATPLTKVVIPSLLPQAKEAGQSEILARRCWASFSQGAFGLSSHWFWRSWRRICVFYIPFLIHFYCRYFARDLRTLLITYECDDGGSNASTVVFQRLTQVHRGFRSRAAY